MTSIATRPAADVCRGLERIGAVPIVAGAKTDRQAAGDEWERVGVVELEAGIERVPASVCRLIGQEDFAIERIERYSGADDVDGDGDTGHLEVVLR